MVNIIGFIRILEKMGCGIVSFNTYIQDGATHFYIMVAEKGDSGIFLKKEGKAAYLHEVFEDMLGELDDLIVERARNTKG